MEELFIYDRDKGLFKQILNQSFVMGGRYHVSSNQGQDLNSNNLDTLVPKGPQQKYPICVCASPVSRLFTVNGNQHEEFTFRLFFLCSTYYGSNGTASRGISNTSTHEVWYDWQDMKNAAADFIQMLYKVIKEKKLNAAPLRSLLNVDAEGAKIQRLSKFNEDRVSGVVVTFQMTMAGGVCEIADYNEAAAMPLIILSDRIHATHKH